MPTSMVRTMRIAAPLSALAKQTASRLTRRRFSISLASAPLWIGAVEAAPSRQALITDFGARPDGQTINTRVIQAAIDHLAGRDGGTVVIPNGVFVSGALFLKPKVDLHLNAGAVLKCTTDMKNFPRQRTRIEGHFEASFTPALINADGCDGLRITGQGTLDGSGRPIWDLFWKLRNVSPDPHNFPNIGLERARLAVIQNSRNVAIQGITFKDSQFWNLHLYKCRDVTVAGARFEVPDDYEQAPSTDGIDLDSCQNVSIQDCYFSVTDDCIAAKGSKGPHAMEDNDSPPVEHIRVRNCHFRRGPQAFACGSEATIVRDVVIEDCRVTGKMNVLMMKLRPDTPQIYEDIRLGNIVLDNTGGEILIIRPWTQYVDLKGQAPPQSTVRNITLTGISGRFGGFGEIRPNPGQTRITGICIKDVDVHLVREGRLAISGATDVMFENVVVNGRPVTGPT